MEQITEFIATNKALQAISIVVAVGTLLIFLYKNVPPAARFTIDSIKLGSKRALARLNRRVAARARIDSSDARLVIVGISFLVLSSWLRILLFLLVLGPIALVVTIGIIKDDQFSLGEAPNIRHVIAFLLGTLSGVAVGWFVFKPINELISYLYWCRRFVYKRRRRKGVVAKT